MSDTISIDPWPQELSKLKKKIKVISNLEERERWVGWREKENTSPCETSKEDIDRPITMNNEEIFND